MRLPQLRWSNSKTSACFPPCSSAAAPLVVPIGSSFLVRARTFAGPRSVPFLYRQFETGPRFGPTAPKINLPLSPPSGVSSLGLAENLLGLRSLDLEEVAVGWAHAPIELRRDII